MFGGWDERASRELGANLGEPVEQGGDLTVGQQPDGAEHGGMCDGTCDVLVGHPQVHVEASRERDHVRARPTLEASVPERHQRTPVLRLTRPQVAYGSP